MWIVDEARAWVWNLDTDEMFEAVRKGEVTKSEFEVWVENKYDSGYDSGRMDGEIYGANEG